MAKSSKGSALERQLCKRLSEWWTGGESDAVFWRTSQSGGRATTRGKKGKGTKNQHGDICATDPIGQPFLDVFACEFKAGYSKFTPFDLIDKADTMADQMFEKWIDQADASRRLSGSRGWMIIFKRDRRLPVVAIPDPVWDELSPGIAAQMRIWVGDRWIHLTPLEDFLAIGPDQIKRLARKQRCSKA